MLPELDTIASRRRTLGLTQTQLAERAGVSQSYIAKLEAKKIEPAYSKVKAILEVLNGLEQGKETKVEEIMTAKIISVNVVPSTSRLIRVVCATKPAVLTSGSSTANWGTVRDWSAFPVAGGLDAEVVAHELAARTTAARTS